MPLTGRPLFQNQYIRTSHSNQLMQTTLPAASCPTPEQFSLNMPTVEVNTYLSQGCCPSPYR
jgi:hypothetical protein